MRSFFSLATIALLSLAVRGQDLQPLAPAPELTAIIAQLGDPNFTARESAQRDLQKIPLAQRDALAALAGKIADEEIKARLIEQVGAMDDRIATECPPISINVTNAKLADVTAAISKAGVPVGSEGITAERFTLNTTQPLWELFQQLSKQHALSIRPGPGTFVVSNIADPMAHMQIIRGIAVLSTDAHIIGPGLLVDVTSALDPRINVIDFHPITIDDATDNLGNHLSASAEADARAVALAIARGRPGLVLPLDQPSRYYQRKNVELTLTDPAAKTLTIRGTASLLVQLKETVSDVADISKHMNESIALGDSNVTVLDFIRNAPGGDATVAGITLQIVPKDSKVRPPNPPRLSITPTGVSLTGGFSSTPGARMTIDNEGSPGGIFVGPAATNESTRIRVTDANDKVVADYRIPRGTAITSVHIVNAQYKEPLKFTFSYPMRTREVKVPFEIKDIPIGR